MTKLAIGVDIGGTNTVFGFVDRAGNCVAKGSIKTKDFPEIDDYVKSLCDEIKSVANSIVDENTIIGIGIGAPNGNFYNGTIEFAPNLDWKGIVPLAQLVNDYFKLPVFLTNDANAAALGEMIYGGAKEMRNFIMITLGTGLGSGLVVNGQLVYGHDGFAGELGHVIVKENGRLCGCGRRGCLETYCSAPGIKNTAIELLEQSGIDSELRMIDADEMSSKSISDAAENGDEIANETYKFTGEVLGLALANSVAHLSPEAIFLFGGVVKAGNVLFDPVKESMERNLLKIYKNKVKILPSMLPEGDAAIVGSSALVWKEL